MFSPRLRHSFPCRQPSQMMIPSNRKASTHIISCHDSLQQPSFEDGGCAKLLPPNFSPTKYDAVIGRYKDKEGHAGNERLEALVKAAFPEYAAAKARTEKSAIIMKVARQVAESNPYGGSGFVKRDPATGRWWDVGEFLGREHTSQMLRNVFSKRYRSSRLAKQQRRESLRTLRLQSSSSRRSSAASSVSDSDTDFDLESKKEIGSTYCASGVSSSDESSSGRSVASCRSEDPLLEILPRSLTRSDADLLRAYSGYDFDPTDNPFEPHPVFPGTMEYCAGGF